MKKNIALIGCLLLLNFFLKAQQGIPSQKQAEADTILQRIVLIGDAGQLTNGKHPVVDAVRDFITLDRKTTILFLGDNLYKNGLPDDQASTYKADRAILDSQLSVAKGTPAKVFMIPGNHDWENGGRGGYEAILRQQLYVDFLKIPNVKYFPEDGCPGPIEVSLGNDVTLIIFDSQWWLHPHDKPEIESDCSCKTKEELVAQIRDIAARNSKKLVLLASHHPFKSNGMHGGYYTLKQHLFPLTDMKKNLYIPLPIIGSIYPIARSVFGTPQDLKHPVYANMISQVSTAVKAAPNLVFVSGHDHNLQHIKDSNYNYIVSGGGCKQNRTSNAKNSLYNNSSTGFSVMEVSKNKNVTIAFYTVSDSAVVTKAYTANLLNFSSLPEAALDTNAHIVDDPFLKYKDTFTIAASKDFPVIKGMKKFFMGQNYRPEWSAPVNMKVFNISKEKGGMKIDGMGGGNQTKSLRLIDKKGKEWVLRSLNKNSAKAIPEAFRGSLAEDLVTELSSASHPYGALVFPALAKPLNLIVPKPELFFVPDDPALGYWRPLFANNVCMLEEKHATIDGTDTKTTAKLLDKMLDENDHLPDQEMVLRARLLDVLTGDFDRHFDQWRWGNIDTGKGKIYYPIPRDRDQAFFFSDGAVLKAVSGRAMPFLKGFRSSIPKVNWLGYTARDFDRLFLTHLDEGDWKKTIADFQQSLPDSVIRNAVKKLPPEIFAIDGEKIINKLISRRNLLPTEALTYYKFISKKVNIVGSNLREYFKVSNYGEGLQVRVYALSRGNDTSFIMYNRVFTPSVTSEIRLYGLNNDDIFDVEENASSRIKLRIIGGKGYDTFDIKGNIETLLYDLKTADSTDGNFIKNSSHAKNRFSPDPPVNDRSILGFNYNTTKLPRMHLNYNSDDGLMAGAGISKRTYGFRNLPYATDQRLSALYAINRKAYQFNYRGEFNHITRSYDLLLQGNFSNPALRNFTGLGNNPKIDKSKNFNYYTTRYRSLELEALLRKRLFEKLHFMVGPYFYHYNNKYSDNADNVLGKFRQLHLDSADIFSKKNYAGGKLALLVDNTNKEFFPTRGMHWYNELTAVTGITKGSDDYIKFTSDMAIYASLREPAKLVAILKAGGGHIFSSKYEYFQALTLGADNGLNGFRKNRLSGTSVLYTSLELKMKLFDVNSFILPGPFGLTAFYDLGRVWLRNGGGSKRWHAAYGGGVYYMPFNLFAITATAGFSEGERMLNFTLGTKINLTY
jgi:Omp85 superfamily domain/Calcineurin-like phosphoesterase